MARSGLLPEVFLRLTPVLDTPYVTLCLGCLLSFTCNIALYFQPELIDMFTITASLASYIVFIAAFIAFLQFHRNYSSLERSYTSPIGDKGAYLGIAVFLICIIGTVGFHDDVSHVFLPCIILVVCSVCSLLFYYFYLQHYHMFSDEEKEELFKAYLINGNNYDIVLLITHFSLTFSFVFASEYGHQE
jgi:amino acid transporter